MATTAMAAASRTQAADQPKSIWEQETLTGDWGGARTALKDRGIDITLNYIGETVGVLSCGVERRTVYDGRLDFSVDTNLQKLIGWTGGKTHVTVYQIQNTKAGIDEYAGSIADPSGIEALHTTRLYAAWFEQSFNDVASLRIGQLAADDEFFTSETAGGLINGTFGWASNLAANMLHSGPSDPMAAPGVRAKFTPTGGFTVLAAVFTGDPVGANCNADADDTDPRRAIATASTPSPLMAARCGWAKCNTPSLKASTRWACRASTSSAPGTRPPISPTSISGSTCAAAGSRWLTGR